MKRHIRIMGILAISFVCYSNINAQIAIKSEWIGKSTYHDKENNKLNGEGQLSTIQLGLQLPISVKYNQSDTLKTQPIAWIAQAKGTYANLSNKRDVLFGFPTEIINSQVGLIYARPITPRWSIISSVGVGLYSQVKDFRFGNLLGQAGIVFIRQMSSNLKLGGGIALNNVLGYPMIFPSLYLDWHLKKSISFNVSLYDNFEISAGMELSPQTKLLLSASANSISAIMNIEEKKQLFITQYSIAVLGLEQEICKGLKARILAGCSIKRDAYFQDLTIRALFNTEEYNPHFGSSPYISCTLKYGI